MGQTILIYYLEKKFLNKYIGAQDQIIFLIPMSIINFCEKNKIEVIDVKHIKGIPSGLPILIKYSPYIGMVIKITQ